MNANHDPFLTQAFGDSVPDSEAETWARLAPHHRISAQARVAAITGFDAKTLTAEEAAKVAGLSANRFYQMAREWRAKPSLASLGTYAHAGRTRPKLQANLRRQLKDEALHFAKAGQDETVEAIVGSWIANTKIPAAILPGRTTLRSHVAEALRQCRSQGLAGRNVAFDMCATSLVGTDGRPHILFAAIDRGTRLILAHVLGSAEDGVEAYRRLSVTCMARMGTWPSDIWSDRLENAELVAGLDEEETRHYFRSHSPQVSPANLQVSTSARRFGRYFREDVGLHLGPILLRPTRTVGVDPDSETPPLDVDHASAKLDLEVKAYNAAILQGLRVSGAEGPPENLINLLRLLAR